MDDDPAMKDAADKCLKDNDFSDEYGQCYCEKVGQRVDCTWNVDECGSPGNPYC